MSKPKTRSNTRDLVRDYKPSCFNWYENDFWADRTVARFQPIQRHFYRALLCAAFFCDTRPYLPDNDEELAELADADSLEQWLQNGPAIRRKFEAFVAEDGTKLLRNKRLDEEWEILVHNLKNASSAGLASAAARAKQRERSTTVERPLNDGSESVEPSCSWPLTLGLPLPCQLDERAVTVQSPSANQPSATSPRAGNKEQTAVASLQKQPREVVGLDEALKQFGSLPASTNSDVVTLIESMIANYPRRCPVGKEPEWREIFYGGIADLAAELFAGNLREAALMVGGILRGFIIKSEGRANVYGPDKFFSKWIPTEHDVIELREEEKKVRANDEHGLDQPTQTIDNHKRFDIEEDLGL